MSTRATVFAPAKVNLALHVLGRRPDGYHDIDTLFQAVDLGDEVEVEFGGKGIELDVVAPAPRTPTDLGPTEENLAYRAAVELLEVVAPGTGVRVRLTKRIPVGAGLGGGSSDAAAVLRCLAELLDVGDSPRLHAIAGGLGSDVPFFLGVSPLARGTGRGEVLEPLDPLAAADLVLVSPPVHVATAAAYRALAEAGGGISAPPAAAGPWRLDSWDSLAGVAHNDFEPVVAGLHPEIARAKDALVTAGAEVALMTGSGSTCFGLFAERESAEGAHKAVREELGWACAVVRTLTAFPPVRRA